MILYLKDAKIWLIPGRRPTFTAHVNHTLILVSFLTWSYLFLQESKSSDRRFNIIKGSKFEAQHSSEVVNDMDSSGENNLNTTEIDSSTAASAGTEDPLNQGGLSEFEKHKNFLSGPLLPSEVCLLLTVRYFDMSILSSVLTF